MFKFAKKWGGLSPWAVCVTTPMINILPIDYFVLMAVCTCHTYIIRYQIYSSWISNWSLISEFKNHIWKPEMKIWSEIWLNDSAINVFGGFLTNFNIIFLGVFNKSCCILIRSISFSQSVLHDEYNEPE